MKPYGTSIYYPSDRIIKDALCQHKISLPEISRLFLRRGIIVSHDSSREDLALYFSRLPYDYYDQERISEALGFLPRRNRTAFRAVDGAVSLSAMEQALRDLKPQIEAIGDKIEISLAPGKLTVELEYSHVDYSRSELTQVRHEQGSIEVLDDGASLLIRHSHNPYVLNILESAVSNLSSETDEPAIQTINLQSLVSPESRTEFFDLLASQMEGFSVEDVSSAYVFKSYMDGPSSLEDGAEDESAEDEGDIRIDKATLRGRRVQNAEELKHLYERGFYCVRLVWLTKELASGLRFILDAGFSNPEDCTEFSYLLRSVHEDQGDGHPPRKRSPLKSEIDWVYSQLESTARKTLATLTQGASHDSMQVA